MSKNKKDKATSKKVHFVSSYMLLGSKEAAAELGIDLSLALKDCGLPPDFLDQSKPITFNKMVVFLEQIAQKYNCPHFGFMVAKHQKAQNYFKFGILGKLTKLSANLEESLKNAFYYNYLYSQVGSYQLDTETIENCVRLVRFDRINPEEIKTVFGIQFHTLTITQVYNVLRELCGNQWQAKYISFRHAKPESIKLLEQYFNVPVYFEQDFDGIVFNKDDLKMPISTADAQLFSIVKAAADKQLIQHKEHNSDLSKARLLIQQTLGSQNCNFDYIAALMEQHPKSLQRSLKKHQTSFKALLSEIRLETAKQYLENSNISLIELSDILGYQNVSAFSKAFKKLSGIAPLYWKLKNNAHR